MEAEAIKGELRVVLRAVDEGIETLALATLDLVLGSVHKDAVGVVFETEIKQNRVSKNLVRGEAGALEACVPVFPCILDDDQVHLCGRWLEESDATANVGSFLT